MGTKPQKMSQTHVDRHDNSQSSYVRSCSIIKSIALGLFIREGMRFKSDVFWPPSHNNFAISKIDLESL